MAAPRPAKPAPPRRGPAAPRPAVAEPPSALRRFLLRATLHLTIAATLTGGLAYAAMTGRRAIERADAVDAPPLTVEMLNRPGWMSDGLTRQIAGAVPRLAASPFDQSVLKTAYDRLAANPWVRQVHGVRRKFGQSPGDTLVIDCDYRAPAALVRWGRYYWLVDNDGVKLPDPFTAADLPQATVGHDGRTSLRTVTGINLPPPESGRKWPGADVAAALDTAKLLYGKPYLDDVTEDRPDQLRRADRPVAAAGGAGDQTRGTQVWWGRPPSPGDRDYYVEVSVARKLATLAAVVKQYGRVDAGRAWLDVRFDTGLLPADDPAAKP